MKYKGLHPNSINEVSQSVVGIYAGGEQITLFSTGSTIFNTSVSASVFSGSFYGDGSNLTGVNSSSNAISASYALTSSYALNTDAIAFPYTGDAVITGSLTVTNQVSASLFSGSFYGDGSNLTGLSQGNRVFNQVTPSSTWSFSHGIGSNYPVVTVYNNSGEVVTPSKILNVDTDTIQVEFGSPVAGYLVVGYGDKVTVSGSTVKQDFTVPALSWSFEHNLGSQFVQVQVFDSNNQQIIPASLTLSSISSSIITFASTSTGYAIATIGGEPIEGFFGLLSGSLSTRVSDLESFSSSIDSVYATDTDLNLVSSSFTSDYLKNTTDTLTGDLVVTGKITAQEFHTEFVSASIVYQSGSTKFGDTSDDVHSFTGSVEVLGGITGSLFGTTTTASYVDFVDIDNKPTFISSSTQLTGTFLEIIGDNVISSSEQIKTNISGAFTDTSSSFSTRISDLELFSSSIDNTEYTYSGSFTGSFSGTATTASYVSVTNVDGFTAYSSSVESRVSTNETDISSLTSQTSSYLQNTTDTLDGDLTVTGKITAQEFHTEFVSASIVYQSGSTKFGDTSDDVMSITGSVHQSGSDSYFLGNVGIGTVSPISFGAGFKSLTLSDTTGGGLGFAQSGTIKGAIYNSGNDIYLDVSNGAGSFYLRNTGDGTNNLTVDSSGNVGIGTDTPIDKLHIQVSSGDAGIQLQAATQTLRLDQNSIRTTTNSGLNIFTNSTVGNGISITSSGNVGIGTTEPSYKLHIEDVTANAVFYNTFNNAANRNWALAFGIGSLGDFNIMASNAQNGNPISSGTSLLNIQSNGNVGIGTTSPTVNKLQVEGSTDGIGIAIKNTGTGGRIYGIQSTGGTSGYGQGKLAFVDESVGARMVIDSSGNVGIGTTSPSNKLHVVADTGPTPTIHIDNTGSDATDGVALKVSASGRGTGIGDAAVFGVHNINGEIFRVQNDGNVGIGTTSPSGKLHLSDSGDCYLVMTGSSTTYSLLADLNGLRFFTGYGVTERMRITSGGNVWIGDDTNPMLEIANGGSANVLSGIKWSMGSSRVDYGGIFSAASSANNNYIVFYTKNSSSAPSERMRIDSSGNVGIGTTSPGAKLQIQADGIGLRLDGTPNTTRTIFLRNTSSTNPAQIYSDGSLRLYTEDAGTDIRFHTVSNGTTNERMRIDSSGNVGIGTTSPSARLETKVSRTSGTNATALVLSDDVTGIQTSGYGTQIQGLSNNGAAVSAIGFEAYGGTNNDTGLGFYTQAVAGGLTRRMTITSTGNVGIGTTDPAFKLDVGDGSTTVQAIRILAGVDGSASLRLKNDAQDWDVNTQTNDTFAIYNQTSGTQPFSILPNGNVGIGVTNPGVKLSIQETGITAAAISTGWPAYNAESAVQSKTLLFLSAGNNGSVSTAGQGGSAVVMIGDYYDSRGIITMQGAGGASPSDGGTGYGKDLMVKGGNGDNQNGTTGGRLFLAGGSGYSGGAFGSNYGSVLLQPQGGNVGIGTTSPQKKVQIETGDADGLLIKTGGYANLTNKAPIYLYGGIYDNGTNSGMAIYSQQTSYNNAVLVFTSATSNYDGTSPAISTEHARIDSNGGYLRLAGGGIQFNGDTAAANALDDYEEGTFTATLRGSVSDPTTPVTTTARYTKIGNKMFVAMTFASVDTTGASGNVTVTGLPIAPINFPFVGSCLTNLYDYPSTSTSPVVYLNNSTTLNFYISGDNIAFQTLQHNAGASRWLVFNITYFVA